MTAFNGGVDLTTLAKSLSVGPVVTAAGSIAVANRLNLIDASSGNKTSSLPSSQPQGTIVVVEKVDTTANTVTVSGSIRGLAASTQILALVHQSVMFLADVNGSWWPIASLNFSPSGPTGVFAGAVIATSVGIAAAGGNSGLMVGATRTVTVATSAAGVIGAPAGTARAIAVTITAVGATGAIIDASSATTVTVAAVGVSTAGLATSAARAIAVAITATGVAAAATGASRSTTVAITAAGFNTTGISSGVTIAVGVTVTSAYYTATGSKFGTAQYGSSPF
jgi:hypothetical protein